MVTKTKKKMVELESEIVKEKPKEVESWRNDQNMNAMSGSEMMMTNLEKRLGPEFLDDFQIILSRVRNLEDNKIRILWCHDMPTDEESVKALSDGQWNRFHRIVFVSNWQMQNYIQRFNIPWSRCVVLKNAIDDIEIDLSEKFDRRVKNDKINFIYHTTPHRGLGILVPVFQKLLQDYGPDQIHLDVYSSFSVYGWDQNDEKFKPLFDAIRDTEGMTYHGGVSNDVVREALKTADVFGYPSCWAETSCMALIEAMSAGCMCVHSNLGALFETAACWTFMYPFFEEANQHAGQFYDMCRHTIDLLQEDHESLRLKLMGQKSFTDVTYTWEVRENEWRAFLNSIRELPREIPKLASEEIFTYEVGY